MRSKTRREVVNGVERHFVNYRGVYDEDFAPLADTTPHGLPLTSAALHLRLETVQEPWGESCRPRLDDVVPGARDRFFAVHGSWVDRFRGPRDDFGYLFRETPIEMLLDVFSIDEVSRLRHSEIVQSQTSDAFCRDPRYQILHKVHNSMWQWGCSIRWNDFVRHYRALSRFDFGVPGFDVTLDHTTSYNERGWGKYNRATYPASDEERRRRSIYLDGVFGYVVRRGDEPALTIGFSLSYHGVLVQQVQLRNRRGNRWLYKLPEHYLDHALARVSAAFSHAPVLLVTAESAVEAHRRSYGNRAESIPPEDDAHIRSVYSRPLARFRRTERRGVGYQEFDRLEPLAALATAS